MKFRRLGCQCCKTGAEKLTCKSPTYVLSEVVDQSNIIFLLISKAGRTSCAGPLEIEETPDWRSPQAAAVERGLPEPRDFSPARRAGEILATCSHPSFRPGLKVDFDRAWRAPQGGGGLRRLDEGMARREMDAPAEA